MSSEFDSNKFNYRDSRFVVGVALLFLIVVGFIIRYFGAFHESTLLYFGHDDYGHFKRAGFLPYAISFETDLLKLIVDSYKDAHPPLRNIILHFILMNSSNIYFARLVAFVPGILLIPSTFYLAYKIFDGQGRKQQYLLGLVAAAIITFLYPLIHLTFETRPYSIMLFLVTGILVSLISFIKKPTNTSCVFFFILSFLIIFDDYSVIPMIGLYGLVMIYLSFRKNRYKNFRPLIMVGVSLQALMVICQFLLVKYQNIKPYTEHVSRYFDAESYLETVSNVPENFILFLKYFMNTGDHYMDLILAVALFIAYILGLGILYKKKEMIYFLISSVPVLMVVLLAIFKFFPLNGTRHNIYLLPCLLIPLLFLIQKITLLNNKLVRGLLLSCLLLLYLFSQGILTSPVKYYKSHMDNSQTYYLGSLSRDDLALILTKATSEKAQKSFLMIERNILKKLDYFKSLYKLEAKMNARKKNLTVKIKPINSKIHIVPRCSFPSALYKIKPCESYEEYSVGVEKLIVIGYLEDKEKMYELIRGESREVIEHIEKKDWFVTKFQLKS